jgi:hypothetical protein
MLAETADSPPVKSPEEKLILKIEQLSFRILRGRAAIQNRSVGLQRFLSVASILLSSAAGVGLIAAKIPNNVFDQSGRAFWGSITLLSFGIMSQIANQFQVGRRASDSETLAAHCGVFKERLNYMLLDEDPRTAVSDLHQEVSRLFESERYNIVLPTETRLIQEEAKGWALTLISKHREFWKLKVIPQRPAGRRKNVADALPSNKDGRRA